MTDPRLHNLTPAHARYLRPDGSIDSESAARDALSERSRAMSGLFFRRRGPGHAR